MIKLIILAFATAVSAVSVGQIRDEILADLTKARGEYRLYPTEFAEQTPVPKGYKPFYISHYGRHGSRYILRNHKFDSVLKVFAEGHDAGKLTPLGEDVYGRLLRTAEVCQGRAGDLSALGQEQHVAIAKRMYETYPEIFRSKPEVFAVSTTVPRCLISMFAFTGELLRHDPHMDLTTDTGSIYMPYLNPYYKDNIPALSDHIDEYRYPVGPWVDEWYAFRREIIDNRRILDSLFAPDFGANIERPYDFVFNLWKVAINTPNTPSEEDYLDLFTPDEQYSWWRLINAIFYYEKGPSGTGGGFLDWVSAKLLKNFIDEADKKVAAGVPAVTLRFGHDGVFMGLFNSMRLKNWSEKAPSMERIEEKWHSFDIPMACNLQWIFYRNPKTGDVLVKQLLNEEELDFPLESDVKPYYHWKDVKALYDKILAEQPLYTPDFNGLK